MTNEAKDLWVWVTRYPDGSVGQVGAAFGSTFDPSTSRTLSARQRETAEDLRPIARLHAARTGQRVWLRRYRVVQEYGDA